MTSTQAWNREKGTRQIPISALVGGPDSVRGQHLPRPPREPKGPLFVWDAAQLLLEDCPL